MNLFGFSITRNGTTSNEIEQPNSTLYSSFLFGKKNVLPYDPYKWYKENPVVFSAIDERAKAISNARYYILTDDGDKIETSLTEFLNKPNPYQTGKEFLKQLVTFLSIWGTAYPYVVRGSRFASLENQSILNLESRKIEFNFKTSKPILELLSQRPLEPSIIYKEDLNYKNLDLENLLPIFDSTTFNNPFYSESRLKSLQYEVSNIQSNLEFKNTVLSSPTGIGMLTSSGKDANGSVSLTPTERKELEEDMAKEYGSGTNQRNVRITSAPVTYQSTVPDLKGLKLDDTQLTSALNVFGHFGLPKELYTALSKGSTFENQKEAYKRFLQGEGMAIAETIANTFNDFYKPTEGKLMLTFEHLPVMQEDESERQEVIKKKIDNLTTALQNNAINQEEYNEHIKNLIQ